MVAFQEYTRGSLPSWDVLLFIYSILVVPVLLALLIGINILVWTRKRISYAFIFGVLLSSLVIPPLSDNLQRIRLRVKA